MPTNRLQTRLQAILLVFMFFFLFEKVWQAVAEEPSATSWTRQWGSTGYEFVSRICVDGSNNIYVAGGTRGSLDGNTSKGSTDIYVTKYTQGGDKAWTKQFGTYATDYANSITADREGNVIVTGRVDASFNGCGYAGGADIFVMKLDGGGNMLWTVQEGTSGNDYVTSICTDLQGNIYITGYAPSGLGSNSSNGPWGIFVIKYNSSGSRLWTKHLGSYDFGTGIAVDGDGNVYVTGYSSYDLNNNSLYKTKILLAKYSPDGTFLWVKYKTNNSVGNDTANDIAVGKDGNIYIAGSTQGGYTRNNAWEGDYLICSYNRDGNERWEYQGGSSQKDYAQGLAFDSAGMLYVVGGTEGGVDGAVNAGNLDAFVLKMTTDGIKVWSKQFGSSYCDYYYGISVDSYGGIYLGGNDNQCVNIDINYTGKNDLFLSKMGGSLHSAIIDPANGLLMPKSLGSYSIKGTAVAGNGAALSKVEVSTDNGTSWNVASDTSGSGTLASWTYKWTPLPLGSWTLKSRATESTGTVEVPGPGVKVTVDDKPSSKITDPINGMALPVALGSYSIKGTAVDRSGSGLKKVEVSTDGGSSWNTASDLSGNGSLTSWVHHWAPLPLGTYSIKSRATDNQDHIEVPAAATVVTVDGSPPTSAITAPLTNALIGGATSYTITGMASDFAGSGVSRVEVSTDGGNTWSTASGTTSWSFSWTLPADGLYTIKTRAVDRAGNTETPGTGVTVEVDKTPPTGSITINGGAAYTGSTSVNLTLSAKDPGRACVAVEPYMCFVDQMQFSANGTTWTAWETANTARVYSLAAGDGLKTVYVKYKDRAGNTSSYSKTITLDTTPPTAAITAPANGATVTSASYSVTGTSTDGAGSGVNKIKISTDGGTIWNDATGTTSWSYSWTIPAAGAYKVVCKTTDNIGNISTTAASSDITAKSTISLNRSSITLNDSVSWPSATTEAVLSAQPWAVDCNPSSSQAWLKTSPKAGGAFKITCDKTGLSSGTYSGNLTFSSSYATNSLTLPVSLTLVPATTTTELQHLNWDTYLYSQCAGCHAVPNKFLKSDFMQTEGICYSCHNASSFAHDNNNASNAHPVLVNISSNGCRMPSYGNITGQYSNRMTDNLKDGKITCMTCHNSMTKNEGYGRTWEYTTTADNMKYFLNGGGWDGYGMVTPRVYRDSTLWAGPAMSKAKKAYLVDPSEYTYNEYEGSVTFAASQSSSARIYVTLDFPYLRVSQESNRMCGDCHSEATHKGANCLNCHQAHNTSNIKGVKETVRSADKVEKAVRFISRTGAGSFADGDATKDGVCEVCHTTTKYFRRDGTGFVNHSGGMNFSGKDCTACHTHSSGFSRQ